MKYVLASLFALALVLPAMAQQPSKEELARMKEKLSAELKRIEDMEKKLTETKKEGDKKEEKKPEPKKGEGADRPGPGGFGQGGPGGFGQGGPGGFGRGGQGGPGGGFGPPWARGEDRQPEPKKEEPRNPGQQQQQQGGERGQFQFPGMPMGGRMAPPIDMKGVMELLEQAAKDNRPYSPRAKELLTKLRSNMPPEGKQPEGSRSGANLEERLERMERALEELRRNKR